MVGDHVHTLADRRLGAGPAQVDDAVLFVQRGDRGIGVLHDMAVATGGAGIRGQRFGPGVHNRAIGGRPADHRGQHRQRTVRQRAGTERDLLSVHVDVGAGAMFGGGGDHMGMPEVGRAAVGDPVHRQAGRQTRGAGFLQPGVDRRRRAPWRIGHQPFEAQHRAGVDGTRQSGCRGRIGHAAAAATGVAFHQDRQRPIYPRQGPGIAGDHIRMVGGDRQDAAVVQRPQPVQLRRADQIVGQEDRTQAGIGHDGRFADLLAGDAGGAEVQLSACQLRHLVGFHMRPQRQPVLVGVGLRVRQVGFDAAQIHHHRRRVEGVQSLGHADASVSRRAAGWDRTRGGAPGSA